MTTLYVIPAELLESLTKYLLTRPAGEVLDGILALQNLSTYDSYLKLNEPAKE